MRARRQHQIAAGRDERRREPRELAIGARAGFDVLARRRERRRIGDHDVEAFARRREPFQFLDDVGFPERAERADAVFLRRGFGELERGRR